MSNFCPFVGTCDDDDAQQPAQDYPSFENQCFALELVDARQDPLEREQLLLADQATYCLGEGYSLCPRYRIARPGTPLPAGFPDSQQPGTEPVQSGMGAGLSDQFDDGFGPPRAGGAWASAIGLLLIIFLCGGSLATYVGWRLVGEGLSRLTERLDPARPEPGQVLVLATATPDSTQRSSFVVVTVPPAGTGVSDQPPAPSPTFDFPVAVTATPVRQQSGPIVITTPTPATDAQPDDPADPRLLTAVAGPVIITTPSSGLAPPTRRPTPVFLVPTSTPVDGPVVIVVTATPAGTGSQQTVQPVVNFRAAHQSLLPGDCTIVSWDVQNVRAVFYEGEGVQGSGERRVCVRYTSETVTLSVLRLDGGQDEHRITVQIVPHTLTPTQTPTETPVLTPTPSWTPDGGSEAATPVPTRIAVSLSVDGGNLRQCSAGSTCEARVQVYNDGDQADEMFVELSKEGDWPAVICRSDGGCGDTSVSFGVGAGTSRPAIVQVEIPDSAAGLSHTFTVGASSGNSNRTVQAEPVQIIFSVP